jgi:hypothetical protein
MTKCGVGAPDRCRRAKKEAAKRAWRPKSREETPKEGSNPRNQVAMHKLIVASHKIKGRGNFSSTGGRNS